MSPRHHNESALALAVLLSSLLQGCATDSAVTASYTSPTQRPSFELVDRRPEGERTTQWLTGNSRSCIWGVRQLGDEVISPHDRMSFLRDSLDAQVHQVLVGRTLLVTHYAIYINDSRRSRTSNGFGAPALQTWITAAIDLHRDHTCRAEEVAEGWLEQGEHAAPTPVIVEISLSLDGQEHQVRKLFSPD